MVESGVSDEGAAEQRRSRASEGLSWVAKGRARGQLNNGLPYPPSPPTRHPLADSPIVEALSPPRTARRASPQREPRPPSSSTSRCRGMLDRHSEGYVGGREGTFRAYGHRVFRLTCTRYVYASASLSATLTSSLLSRFSFSGKSAKAFYIFYTRVYTCSTYVRGHGIPPCSSVPSLSSLALLPPFPVGRLLNEKTRPRLRERPS